MIAFIVGILLKAFEKEVKIMIFLGQFDMIKDLFLADGFCGQF
jgi:hypothetical protein